MHIAKSKYCKGTVFLIIILLFCTRIQAQLDTAALSASISKNKEKLVKESVWLIYKNGKIVYKNELGGMNLKTQQNLLVQPANGSPQLY